MKKSTDKNLLLWLGNIYLILIGIILFLVGVFPLEGKSTAQDVVFQIAGALLGAGLVYVLLRVVDPVELDDIQKIIDDKGNDEVKKEIALMIQKSTNWTVTALKASSLDLTKFYTDLRLLLLTTNINAEVVAVCGDKEWTSLVDTYMQANYDTIRSNHLTIERIFIEDAFFRLATYAKMDEQVQGGVKVFFLEKANIPAKTNPYYLPPGFGFVIISNQVYVHNKEYGYRFDDDLIRTHFRQIYLYLKQLAKPYP